MKIYHKNWWFYKLSENIGLDADGNYSFIPYNAGINRMKRIDRWTALEMRLAKREDLRLKAKFERDTTPAIAHVPTPVHQGEKEKARRVKQMARNAQRAA